MALKKVSETLLVVWEGTVGVSAAPVAASLLCLLFAAIFSFPSFFQGGNTNYGYSGAVFFIVAILALIVPGKRKISINNSAGKITLESVSPLGFRHLFLKSQELQISQVKELVLMVETDIIQISGMGNRAHLSMDEIDPNIFDLAFALKDGQEYYQNVAVTRKEASRIASFLGVNLKERKVGVAPRL